MFTTMLNLLFIFFITIQISSLSNAQGLFGPEWTFTAPNLLEDVSSSKMEKRQYRAQRHLLEAIQIKCGQICEVHESTVRLKSNPEIYFKIKADKKVIEVNAPPLSSDEYQKYSSFFTKYLFEPAASVDLVPHSRIGGGHIHLDIETHFNGDTLLMRNFIVDLINHPELFLGVLGLDLLNAPPLQVLEPIYTQDFMQILEKLDSRKITFEQFIKEMNEVVYRSNHVLLNSYPQTLQSPKFQLINLMHWPRTIEIRGFGPQQSMEHYLAHLKILESRIHYLKQFKQPLSLKINNLHHLFSFSVFEGIHSYKSKMEYSQVIQRSRRWIEESGLSWSYMSKWLNPELQKSFKINRCRSVHF